VHCYKVVTITHKTTKVNRLKDYLLTDSDTADFPANRLQELKSSFRINELFYLNTCNRVTFFFTHDSKLDDKFLKNLFLFINPGLNKELINLHVSKAMLYEGKDAIHHFFAVAASLDSLVIGEREILGQIKQAYQQSKKYGLCGDNIRLAVEQAIVFAKRIHTETRIGEKPISVVSLAYRSLMERNLPKTASILMIGAGQTNHLMANLLIKSGFHNVSVYNRTLNKGEELAARFGNGRAFPLEQLSNHNEEFEAIITCTGANYAVLQEPTYKKIIGDTQKKMIIIDLAVPEDVDAEILKKYPVDYIDVASLEQKAKENMQFRKSEMFTAEALLEDFLNSYDEIFKERKLELALSHIPDEVKNIRETAMEKAFKKDLENLDDNSRELLEKMMQYMEEKYIALPFKASKKSLLKKFNS
jgi:glutamyl-tRNA reductase